MIISPRPVDLRVSGRTAPIGIDDGRPSLAWRLDGPGGEQDAYQILVATSAELLAIGRADLWDSGRVESGRCTGVAYKGNALVSRQICFWTVRVWSQDGRDSQSDVARWEMGLLNPADWRGEWLAAESAIERDDRETPPQWAQAPVDTEGRAVFRLPFHVRKACQATIIVAVGGLMRGARLDGQDLPVPHHDPNAFGPPPTLDITAPLVEGDHLLEIDAGVLGGMLVRPTVAIAGLVRIGSDPAERTTSGWLTLGPNAQWSAAAPASADQSPEFPWPPRPASLLRRAFEVEGAVVSARLYVAALGGYDLSINGARVGEAALQPDPTDFRLTVPYRVHDVTGHLHQGSNAIGLVVADGVFASYLAPTGRYSFGAAPRRARLALAIRLAGAQDDIWIFTDDQWRIHPSSVVSSEIYNGEQQDFRLAEAGWDAPDFDDSHWTQAWTAPEPQGTLVAPLAPPIVEKAILAPVSVEDRGGGRHIVDFGQNFAGRLRLTVRGEAGQTVTVRHAEILNDAGELDVRNLRAARATDAYTLADGAEVVLEPRFTYQGFRYAEVSGLGALATDAIEGVVLSSDLKEIGDFKIGEPLIQQLWRNTLWSQRSNFLGVPMDCPQRDERLGWTGDAQIFWDTAAFNMDVHAFTRGYAREVRGAQLANGAFPIWAPQSRLQHPMVQSPLPGWADAGVELPYVAFLHSGDRQIVDENWDAMERYVSGILANNPDHVWRNGRGFDLGDWLSLDAQHLMDETTPKDLIGTAMLARSVSRLAQMAEWTGRTAAAQRWRSEDAAVRDAFANAFVGSDGVVGNGSHTSYILALRLGLVPVALRAQAGKHLAVAIRRRGTLLTTGFLGTPMALDALADVGEAELAWSLLLRTEYPSWGYMVEKGATTIWERWNGDTGDVAMNSYNHYALGAVCGFLYRRIAGIEPTEPGFRRFRFAPIPDPRTSHASARYDSVLGRVEAGWRYVEEEIRFDLRVPQGAEADIELPGVLVEPIQGLVADQALGVSRGRLGPGHYALTIRPAG